MTDFPAKLLVHSTAVMNNQPENKNKNKNKNQFVRPALVSFQPWSSRSRHIGAKAWPCIETWEPLFDEQRKKKNLFPEYPAFPCRACASRLVPSAARAATAGGSGHSHGDQARRSHPLYGKSFFVMVVSRRLCSNTPVRWIHSAGTAHCLKFFSAVAGFLQASSLGWRRALAAPLWIRDQDGMRAVTGKLKIKNKKSFFYLFFFC